MSLILEALRKSEAERQRGRAPGLFVEQMPARTRRREGPKLWPWLVVAALVVAGLGWAWFQGAGNGTRAPVISATTAPDERVATPATMPAAEDVPMISPLPPPEIATAHPEPAPAQSAPVPREVAPAATATVQPDPIAEIQAAPAAGTATVAGTASVADAAPVAPAPPVAALGTPAAATEPTPETYATVASLPAAERAQLPPLKLSMHVYADAPAQRFVILDGQRLGEGATPAAGVVIEQIRRDGIVLSVNGHRVLLQRP